MSVRDWYEIGRDLARGVDVCRRPPHGWRCPLDRQHRGPCPTQASWWNVSGRWWGRTKALR